MNRFGSPTDRTLPQMESLPARPEVVPVPEEVLFDRPVRFLTRATFEEIIEEPFDLAQDSATTISVLNKSRIRFTNSEAVNITSLTDGQDGQLVFFLGDGFTTLVDNATLELGANLLLTADKVHPLLCYSGKWFPLSAGSAYTAGNGINITALVVTNLYVGKSITLFGGEILTTVGGPHPFPNNVRKAAVVADTTGMGQFRISVTASSGGTGGIIPSLSYSTDGSSWSNITGISTMNNFAAGTETRVSAWTALPAGAKGATMYLAFRSEVVTANVTVNTVSVELKP